MGTNNGLYQFASNAIGKTKEEAGYKDLGLSLSLNPSKPLFDFKWATTDAATRCCAVIVRWCATPGRGPVRQFPGPVAIHQLFLSNVDTGPIKRNTRR